MVQILLADDQSIVRFGLRSLIEARTAWEVCGEATTGHEAVSLTAELQPDVAVLGLSTSSLNRTSSKRCNSAARLCSR